MKKFLAIGFWAAIYIIFVDFFACNIIIHEKWDVLSPATIYMGIAAFAMLNIGSWLDR